MDFEGGYEVGEGGANVRKSPLKFSFSSLLFFDFGSELEAKQDDDTSLQMVQWLMVWAHKSYNYNIRVKKIKWNYLEVELPKLNPLPLPHGVFALVPTSAKGDDIQLKAGTWGKSGEKGYGVCLFIPTICIMFQITILNFINLITLRKISSIKMYQFKIWLNLLRQHMIMWLFNKTSWDI